MRARYDIPFGRTSDNNDAHSQDAATLDCLLETPLDSFPVNQPGKGAVVPIWLTVKAPKDAKPGVYRGKLTVVAGALQAAQAARAAARGRTRKSA